MLLCYYVLNENVFIILFHIYKFFLSLSFFQDLESKFFSEVSLIFIILIVFCAEFSRENYRHRVGCYYF